MIAFRQFKSNRSPLLSSLRFPKTPSYESFCRQAGYSASLGTYSRHLMSKEFARLSYNRNEVLIPEYMCNTLVDAIFSAGAKPCFYPIDFDNPKNLEQAILEKVKAETGAVVIVDFFGVRTEISKSFREALNSQAIFLMRDASHAYLTLIHQNFQGLELYDRTFTSIYKSVPTQIGALMFSQEQSFIDSVSFWEFIKITVRNFLIKCVISLWNPLIERKMLDLRSRAQEQIYDNVIFFNKIFAFIFHKFLYFVNEDRLIQDRKACAKEIHDSVLKTGKGYLRNLYSAEQVQESVFMAYPLYFPDVEARNFLCKALQAEGIDVYTWPVFSELNVSPDIWKHILLLPVSYKLGSKLEASIEKLWMQKKIMLESSLIRNGESCGKAES